MLDFSPSARRLAGVLLLAALAAGALAHRLNGIAGGPAWSPRNSFDFYASPGESLIHGIREGSFTYRMPLATVAAALIYGHMGLSTPLANAVFLGSLTLFMLLTVAGLLRLGARGMLAVVVLWSFFPAAGGWGFYPQCLFSDFVLLVAGTAAWRSREPSDRSTLLLALAVGVSLLFRSTLVFLPPALFLYDYAVPRAVAPRARLRQALILLLVPVLFLIPWLRMNWAVSRRILPLEDGQASCNVVTGALGVLTTVEGPWKDLLPEAARTSNRAVFSWAAAEALRHPARYAAAYLKRAWLAFGPWQFPLSLLAVPAFWIGRRRDDVRMLSLLAAYLVGVYCFMSIQPEYFDPLHYLLILAAGILFSPSGRTSPAIDRSAKAAVLSALAAALILSFYVEYRVTAVAAASENSTELLERKLEESPDDPWLLIAAGRRRLERGRSPDALRAFERAELLLPAGSVASFLAAKAAVFSGRLGSFAAHASRVADADPELHLLRADADLASGDEPRAMLDMRAAREAAAASAQSTHDPSPYPSDREFVAGLRAHARSNFLAGIDTPGGILNGWPPADRRRVERLLAKMSDSPVAAARPIPRRP